MSSLSDDQKRSLSVLYNAAIEIRALSTSEYDRSAEERLAQIYDLIDAMHNVPALVAKWDPDWRDFALDDLKSYAQKWGTNARFDYAAILREAPRAPIE